MHKILSITEKIPQITSLPDGLYNGSWSGYEIGLFYNNKSYILTTEERIRGVGIKVIVMIKDGIATFDIVNN